MCVIVVKPMGSDFAPVDIIEQCFKANPHGFAFAYNQGGELKTFRTLDMTEAVETYKGITRELNPAETAMIVHARLRTHGPVTLENCHCWTHGDIAFAHNGVLDIESKDNKTDSEIFFRELFAPAMDALGLEYALKMARMFIGSTNNKFAFIDKNGSLWMTGRKQSFVKESFPGCKGKVYFSNTRWKPVSEFSSCLGFNPYEGVSKKPASEHGKSFKMPHSVSTPAVGPRKQVHPEKPLAIKRGGEALSMNALFGEDLYEKLYQDLVPAV